MGINVSAAKLQAHRLGSSASQLKNIKGNFQTINANLKSYWQGDEIAYVNSAFNNIENELSTIASTLLQLEKDIIDAAIRIQQREIAEAKAKAEAEARAKAEAEAKAQAVQKLLR